MLRLWLTRRWLVATALAIGFAVGCFFLGQWQWSRHVEQRTKVTAIESNYAATAVPLSTVWSGSGLAPERQWTRVALTGRYAAGGDLFVRNRTLDDRVGFEVLTPFTVSELGELTVLVDRGWVPNATDASTTPGADLPVAGTVQLTGWLRSGEPALGRDLPAPQLSRIAVAEARRLRPEVSPVDVYVVLGSQQPPTVVGASPIRPLPPPDEGLGPHQAYAFQWWLTMPAGAVFVVWAMRREQGGREPGTWAGTRGPSVATAARTVATEPREPVGAKPKKVRIWDEEDA